MHKEMSQEMDFLFRVRRLDTLEFFGNCQIWQICQICQICNILIDAKHLVSS